ADRPLSPSSPAPSTVAEPPVSGPAATEAQAPGAPPSEADAAAAQALGTTTADFALTLYRQLDPDSGNRVLSPASISLALAMTASGARQGTRAEMLSALRVTDVPDVDASAQALLAKLGEDSTLHIANRLFGERTFEFRPDYMQRVARSYGAPLETLDFRTGAEAARVHINDWVSERTQSRINDLLPPRSIGSDSRLVLVNAVHFLGRWATPFDPARTSQAPFHRASGGDVSVPTMTRSGRERYGADEAVQVVELPYADGDLAMVIVVPRDVDGLPAVERSLDMTHYVAWTALLQPNVLVNLSLPRFEIAPPDTLALRSSLERLGMRQAFARGQADFLGIADPASAADRLYVSEVFHKAFVRVDEAGTEAAAATAVVMARSGGRPQVATVTADRPFLFFIRDTATGAVLFMGRVADPS
ncbi:MAG: serpin family protein, partial [Polyangiales bacterium]